MNKVKTGLIISLLVFLDQLSKLAAVRFLKEQAPIQVIPGVFKFSYVENRGVAFGVFSDKDGAVYLSLVIALIMLLILYFRYRLPLTKHYQPLRNILLLVLSGALGNLIDRVRLGYVIDMLYFHWFEFPVFNLADMYVVIGGILILFFSLTKYRSDNF